MPRNPSDTAQPERKLIGCAMEEGNMSEGGIKGYGKIKLHHLHCHSELLLQETVYPYKSHYL